MYLDNLLPKGFAAFAAPKCLWKKILNPSLVSFGLMANLASARRRGLIRDIDAIIDVGANVGQYAYMAHAVWPDIPVFSFEPDPECYAKLQSTFHRHSLQGQCFQLAVGDRSEERYFRLQENSAQSSFLARSDVDGGCTREIPVQCTTLDDAARLLPRRRDALLKVDTQGYEIAVLAGAREFLTDCAFVQIEVAFRRSYEGQPDAIAVMSQMRDLGFVCVEILDILRDQSVPGGPIAEADLLFARDA